MMRQSQTMAKDTLTLSNNIAQEPTRTDIARMDSCVKACVVIGDVQAEVLHHTEKWVEDAYNDNAAN